VNILRLSIAALTLAAGNVVAAEAVMPASLDQVSVRGDTRLVIDCRNERVPTQRAVGRVLDNGNGALVYAERERLVHIAHRECMRGASSVAFVRDTSEQIPALALVDAGSQP
jgi:hypothetical protein